MAFARTGNVIGKNCPAGMVPEFERQSYERHYPCERHEELHHGSPPFLDWGEYYAVGEKNQGGGGDKNNFQFSILN